MVEHAFVAGLQLVPVGPLPQSGSSVATLHCLHTPDGPGFTQRWLFGAPTLPQSAFAVHGAQALVESSQRAAVAVVHDAGVHVHVLFVSHAGVEGVVLHAPVSIPMQGTHRCIATLHTGVAASPAQSVLALHCTHSCEIGSHTAPPGFPTQSEAAAHSPQMPAATHTGVVPEQAGLQSVASGGVNASRPLSGIGGSNASRPGASRLASNRGPVSRPLFASESAQRPPTIVLPAGHSDEGQPERAKHRPVNRVMRVMALCRAKGRGVAQKRQMPGVVDVSHVVPRQSLLLTQ